MREHFSLVFPMRLIPGHLVHFWPAVLTLLPGSPDPGLRLHVTCPLSRGVFSKLTQMCCPPRPLPGLRWCCRLPLSHPSPRPLLQPPNREIAALAAKGEIRMPENFDVFAEKGVFEVEQTRRLLEAGQGSGMSLNFHAEELHHLGTAQLGAQLGAQAMSHLEHVDPDGIVAMATAGVAAVVLPTTAHVLRLAPPPVRDMINAGVAVALGTDFNPNAHCLSMPLTMNLACVLMHMSLDEALIGATINAASSLGRAKECGSLEPGKRGDLVLLSAPAWQHIVYQMADPVVEMVAVKGRVVYRRPFSGVVR